MLLTSFYLRKERTIPNSLYKPNIRIIWIRKPNKDITKKKKKERNYTSISLMNICERILNKVFANKIQENIKNNYSF